MKSLHERLLDAAMELENENYHNQAKLLREAAAQVPNPSLSAAPISKDRNCHPCPVCDGTGWTGAGRAGVDSCATCKGTGHTLTGARRSFDPALVGSMAQLIYEAGMHASRREDTAGVLMYYGAYNGEAIEAHRSSFITDLAAAIDEWKASRLTMANRAYSVERPKFGNLGIGEHFICVPIPGDNHGHGGYMGEARLFVKTSQTSDIYQSGLARSGSGVVSTFPHSNAVIRVTLG